MHCEISYNLENAISSGDHEKVKKLLNQYDSFNYEGGVFFDLALKRNDDYMLRLLIQYFETHQLKKQPELRKDFANTLKTVTIGTELSPDIKFILRPYLDPDSIEREKIQESLYLGYHLNGAENEKFWEILILTVFSNEDDYMNEVEDIWREVENGTPPPRYGLFYSIIVYRRKIWFNNLIINKILTHRKIRDHEISSHRKLLNEIGLW